MKSLSAVSSRLWLLMGVFKNYYTLTSYFFGLVIVSIMV